MGEIKQKDKNVNVGKEKKKTKQQLWHCLLVLTWYYCTTQALKKKVVY